jgi:L-lysine exporter family protein LysE/ArgO
VPAATVGNVIDVLVAGLLTGLSLIVAIGAQNAYVLRQGLMRAHVGPVVVVCLLSDYVLIVAGVTGLGAVVHFAPWALAAARWLGVAFLCWYGLRTAWHALHPEALAAGAASASQSRSAAIRRAMALTWLNPHVYLDTVVLLGSIASTHGPSGRWWFAFGACLASTFWFVALGYGARLLAPLLARPGAWRVLDFLIAATMLFIAVQLAAG